MKADKIQLVSIACVVRDRLADIDTVPRVFSNEAEAMRAFKIQVNTPSHLMIYNTPGDFELVRICEFTRNVNGDLLVSDTLRSILLTGSAAMDQDMRDGYARMASLAQGGEVKQ